MKRCTQCRRYATGQPTFCPYCGRSYDVRICARGHPNPRHVQFCTTCGSEDLSTPAPPEPLIVRASRLSLKLAVVAGSLAVGLAVVLALLSNAGTLVEPLLLLVIWLVALRWLVGLAPGPVRTAGKAAGRLAIKAVRKRRKRE